uniref:Uncharacterized protein n=1 Tax=Sphaerodactylus townsendi TaxID=933632 RepID=A0ACB8F0T2_9SAUR
MHLFPSLQQKDVLGPATTSILNEAEEEASNLMREETNPSTLEADSPDNLHSLMNCRICQLFVRTVDRLLDKSEEMMDQYMPLTEEEICNLKQAVEELDVSSADHQKSDCFNRITALSYRLRQRAYMMALSKLRLTRRSTHSTLSQLHETLDLIEQAQQGEEPESQRNHQKLGEMCTQWTQQRQGARDNQEAVLSVSDGQREAGAPFAPDGSPGEAVGVPGPGSTSEAGTSSLAAGRNTLKTDTPSAKDCSSDEVQMIFTTPACREENGFASTEVESKTLEMSRKLTLDLKGTYENLLGNLKDMPLSLKHKLYQTYGHMAELHAKFATANSFADLPGSILEKGLAIMAQAQDSMDEVMEFAFLNPMGILADNLPLVPVTTETHSAQPEEGDILKIQAAYDPKGCDEHN